MITEVSAHRVEKATIEGPLWYSGYGLPGYYQRIRLYDDTGREVSVISVHFNAGASPLPATEEPK